MNKPMNIYADELPIVVGSWCEPGPSGKRHFLPYSDVESRRGMKAWHRINCGVIPRRCRIDYRLPTMRWLRWLRRRD